MPEMLEGHTAARYDEAHNHVQLRLLEMGGLILDQRNQALTAARRGDGAMKNIWPKQIASRIVGVKSGNKAFQFACAPVPARMRTKV